MTSTSISSSGVTVTGLYAQQLPSYTSERYYLLSELENASSFIFLDETAQSLPVDEQANESIETFVVYYILWDMNAVDANIAFQEKIKQLKVYNDRRGCSLRDDASSHMECLVVVEAMHTRFTTNRDVTSASADDDSITCALKEALALLHRQLSPGLVCFAVSNNIAGTAGLDVCLDVCNSMTVTHLGSMGNNKNKKKKKSQRSVEIVCIDRISCLGHDPDREPDATSDVHQQLFLSQDTDIASWSRSRSRSRSRPVVEQADTFASRDSRRTVTSPAVAPAAGLGLGLGLQRFIYFAAGVTLLAVIAEIVLSRYSS